MPVARDACMPLPLKRPEILHAFTLASSRFSRMDRPGFAEGSNSSENGAVGNQGTGGIHKINDPLGSVGAGWLSLN